MLRRIIVLLMCFCLLYEQTGLAQVAGQFVVPAYLSGLMPVADHFRPVQLRAIELDQTTNDFHLLLIKETSKALPRPGRGIFQ